MNWPSTKKLNKALIAVILFAAACFGYGVFYTWKDTFATILWFLTMVLSIYCSKCMSSFRKEEDDFKAKNPSANYKEFSYSYFWPLAAGIFVVVTFWFFRIREMQS